MYQKDGLCLTKESVVGETADQVQTNLVVGGAVTTNRNPPNNCQDARSIGTSNLAWIAADVTLVKVRADGSGSFTCAFDHYVEGEDYESEAKAQVAARCGAGDYYVIGDHEALIPPYPYTNPTSVSVTPEGYNA